MDMLGKNIKELRLERGLTQLELANKIGVTQGAVYFWEKGINEPTAGYLIAMAKIFSVTVDELLSFESRDISDGDKSLSEINRLFLRLNDSQREVLILTAKEFLKN